MIFEFSIARNYLIPRKRQLSMSLIALMSVGVISLVVWLVLVFWSVTNGIEKNWLKKLTAISAPLRLTPTDAYYSSYYYQIDGISSQSDYTYKSIGEKALAPLTDPYLPEWDQEIPKEWPEKMCQSDGSTKDLVKEAFDVLKRLNLSAQDYETSGAVLNLEMLRSRSPFSSSFSPKETRYLIQLFYLSTFNEKNPTLLNLIEPPRIQDLNHLFLSPPFPSVGSEGNALKLDGQDFQEYLNRLLSHITIEKMRPISHRWDGLKALLSEGVELNAHPLFRGGAISQLVVPVETKKCPGKILKKGAHLYFVEKNGVSHPLDHSIPIFVEDRVEIKASLCPPLLEQIKSLKDLSFKVKVHMQGKLLEGIVPWEGIEIQKADIKMHFDQAPEIPPLWPYFVEKRGHLPKESHGLPIVLPKCLQKSGVLLGDMGHFCYGKGMHHSMQERSLPVIVSGFYDPGVIPIGGKIALTCPELPHMINQAYAGLQDPAMKNGIQVYLDDLKQTKKLKQKIETAFQEKGLAPYWEVTSFEEYDSARDLLQQFQSDKYLFTLIAIIVLIVACSNIISFLILLVNDKRKEIAILSAMGASKKSIALIFTLCGGIVGTLSTLMGTICAILTLHYIDGVVHFLSFLQGHDAFNPMFYGKSLPNQLSSHILTFILIATPILSLLAGLIPALKATKLHPSTILRSE